MSELGYSHFSTLTGLDQRTEYEVVYHLFGKNTGVSIGVKISHNDPHIETITDIMPGALIHERELQDLMGIKVDNIPDGRRIVIPEDWPADQFPLRKDWNMSMLPDSFNDGLLRKWTE
jgi:Ni,Fe-hydrogenase III component G